MDWERAKTTLIIIFLLLNAGLLVMNIRATKSYKMTDDEAAAITKILADNDITLSCTIPPENRPVRFLNVTPAEWEYENIKNIFFPSTSDITRTYEEGSVIYGVTSTGETVTVTNAYDSGFSSLIYRDPSVTKTPDEYRGLLGVSFDGFELQRAIIKEEDETFIYNEVLKHNVIFSSYAEVSITAEGAAVTVYKYDYDSYVEGIHEIFRADEALLTFMHYKNKELIGDVTIESLRLGYLADGTGSEKIRRARPCWRIYVAGIDEPIYIDAIMNTVL